jgi:large subunit ribosomal protein L4
MKLRVVRTTSRDSHVTVSDELFTQANPELLAQAVKVYLSNQRQGTSQTQSRSEVNRTTRKWYAQKGTGNARHGAQDAALFVGGSIAHGPTGQENWQLNLSQQQKLKALAAALTAQSEHIVLNDEIKELKGKTKPAHQLLQQIVAKFEDRPLAEQKLLLVVEGKLPLLERAVANIPDVTVAKAAQLNALAVAAADKIIMTSQALEELVNRYESVFN